MAPYIKDESNRGHCLHTVAGPSLQLQEARVGWLAGNSVHSNITALSTADVDNVATGQAVTDGARTGA